MKLKIDKRYLALPVSEHAQVKKLCFRDAEHRLLYDLDVKLDPVGAQHVYYADLRRFIGMELDVEILPGVQFCPKLSDSVPEDAEGRFRPVAHFTPQRGWINDPNGLVLYEGKYHLFYQHNPVGMNWGNMHWGHAVSDDLIHWQEKEIVLFPDEFGTMYSGCAVIDEKNVSGLKHGDHDPLLLFYTAAGDRSLLSQGKEHVQCLAYSTDGGETFEKYDKNPIIGHIIGGNRDPKVIFSPELNAYVMALYLEGKTYALFRSENLLNWKMMQKIDLPGDAECPDFFPLYLDGEKFWILSGASDFYFVGKIKDGLFVPVQEIMKLKGSVNTGYAAQTYFGLPDNRRVRFYWNTFSLPGMPFNCSMSTPVELFLTRTDGKIKLSCRPIEEFDLLHGEAVTGRGSVRLPGKANDIQLSVPSGSGVFRVSLFGMVIEIDAGAEVVRTAKAEIPARAVNDVIQIRIVQDVHSTEIFTEDGTGYLCVGHLADQSLNRLEAPDCVTVMANELKSYR